MSKIEKVLIHPARFDSLINYWKVWNQWESSPTTHIIPDGDMHGLLDTRYLEEVEHILRVGGRTGAMCVPIHLNQLASHPRVKDQSIVIVVDQVATLCNPNAFIETLLSINVKYGITIEFA